MAKISFDIKYRPQIESGEYKVETECGHTVSIMDWEWIDHNEKKCLAVKVLMDEGFNIGYLFDYDGKRHSIFPSDSDSDLFIITPEEELTEFENRLCEILDSAINYQIHSTHEEIIADAKKLTKELLELAEKELEEEVPEMEFTPIENTLEYKAGFRAGKAEALKDLPRWKKATEYMKLGPNDFVLTLDRDGKCSPYWDTEVEEGQFYITESDIENLPKEDEK